MTEPAARILRYFDARGRAQFIRYYLLARGIACVEERVPLDPEFTAWRAMRADGARTGPFHKLPVLHWDGETLAETRVISSFLYRAFGDDKALDERSRWRHEMLVSSLYDDVMMPIGTLLWSDVMYPGADLAAWVGRALERLRMHLASLNETLAEWRWLEEASARNVMLADCLLWEELDVAQLVFGPGLRLDEQPYLARCYRELGARSAGEELLAERPSPVTARPGEVEAIAKIRALAAV
jgi:glutathione S-transferase